MKAYRVDFKFVTENEASLYIVAKNEAEASEGAMEMLNKTPSYTDPEIVKVEEYTVPINNEVTLN